MVNTASKYKFRLITSEAHRIKVLCELLQHSLKQVCFEIDKSGIKLRLTDTDNNILIDLDLERESFRTFKCPEPLFIGINSTHLYKMLKSIKKKESLELYIEEKNPSYLTIRIQNSDPENNSVGIDKVRIQNVQNIDIALPDGYEDPIVVPSSEFSKLLKSMNNISKKIFITSHKDWIHLFCDAGEIYNSQKFFGDKNDIEEDMENLEKYIISKNFPDDWNHFSYYTSQLTQFIKISGLCKNLQVFVDAELPLLFKLKVGNLGRLSIYIKSIEQITMENKLSEEEGEIYEDDSGDSDEESE